MGSDSETPTDMGSLTPDSQARLRYFPNWELPEGWRWASLGAIARIRRGASPRPAGDPRYFGGSIPWFRIGDATATSSRYLTQTVETVNEEGAKRSVRIPPGSLIVANSGVSLGFATIVQVEGCIHDGWLLLDDLRGVEKLYLFYIVNALTSALRGMADGTTQPNLNTTIAKALEIPLPPPSDQKRIIELLDAIDTKIEVLTETNATLEALAAALFKSWFVDFDPVRAKSEGRDPEGVPSELADLFPSEFVDSKFGAIPKGWKVAPLDSIADFLNGLAMQKFPVEDESDWLPVIKIAQLRKGDTEGSDRASLRVPSDYVVQDGDVLFSWSGSLEVDIWCGGRGGLNQHLFKVTSKCYPKWFYYLWTKFHLPSFRQTAAHKATTMGHIQRCHLTAAQVIIPPEGLLKAISETIAPLIQQAWERKLEARTLAAVRDTLIPSLISGKLRIPDAQEISA